MSAPCYSCGIRAPQDWKTICRTCEVEARAKSNRPPLTEGKSKEVCVGCGLRFINAWEQYKHEVLGTHHYRAWDQNDGKQGMAARRAEPPDAPPTVEVLQEAS